MKETRKTCDAGGNVTAGDESVYDEKTGLRKVVKRWDKTTKEMK